MTTAIKIENLSKKYLIGHQKQERYTALRDVMMHKLRGIGQRLRHPLSPNREELEIEEFWALKDINLEIQQGDRVGIIGRNGAGKSTLLKILSRITEPTKGRVHLNGRVASLLEVGTGFHPELTGRENIYLNGAILGMSRAEIKRKFDEIVDFSGVEKFLDTPVKRYSSGMYVRLAFAVAAHLEPEILVVDEVLAVGDAQFQKKCLGKMEEVGKEGRTVLFVSHNMAAIEALCCKAVCLDKGKVVGFGDVTEQIENYLSVQKGKRRWGGFEPVFVDVLNISIVNFELSPNPVESGDAVHFFIEMCSSQSLYVYAITILIYSLSKVLVGVVDLRDESPYVLDHASGSLRIRGNLVSLPLVEGDYEIALFVNCDGHQETLRDLVELTVVSKPQQRDVVPYSPSVRGIVEFESDFVVEKAVDGK